MPRSNEFDTYQSPLAGRYAGKEMSYNFSDHNKYSTWRKLWIVLADTQRTLGIKTIKKKQIDEMVKYQSNIDFTTVMKHELRVKHDVMAHIHAFGDQCPNARPIIHLGATSAFVQDNADLILIKKGLNILLEKMVNIVDALASFAKNNRDIITLGFTHYQPAQLTTVGKRACLWIQDFIIDIEDIEYRINNLRFRGAKGTIGTQNSFMSLFGNDEEKVKLLDKEIAHKMGFKKLFPITGQIYPRKADSQIADVLSGIAQSAHKFSNDIRLLQNLREIEEPFGKKQIGSSAMPYKRNPMRCERVASIARYIICNSLNTEFTSGSQWLERTLDDSANRRLVIPETFLATDAMLNIVLGVARGLVVYPKVIAQHVNQELPFMASEDILMESVKAGSDRQKIHEKIRTYSMEAATLIKENGVDNDLLDRIQRDKDFDNIKDNISNIMNPKNFVGRAPQQVDEYITTIVKPIQKRYKKILGLKAEFRV
ncbi:MAG: adenylosuccinate lyase [Candidatus Scalindua sp. AMX11]|nr:MAG: adenylosuccinate lyase [Candidatus Scalindua sp.]NOG83212.1 adenylosuccinate lyase [Planctomycetota bacterium]RZV77605.1 MAG: adenylosuccinate lyase [Candidatus Scalindua sp. SCAELEC01]TDE64586.1 MAG: adenylosuccinate lyase [Candidatus Scalindua sp. AMX11]GJQ58644.1 MAG: adenylosuccinate lyase [Candidatus Scalindua sp.]